jgi:lipopolysaccharide export system permease protein
MGAPMGKTLRKYLIGEIGTAFLAGLAIFTFILLVARIIDLVDLVLARGVPGRLVLSLFGYILPSFLEFTIPMATLLSVVVAFGRLTSDGELVAMRAAGISAVQMLRPVLTIALGIGAVTLVLAIRTGPWANRELKETVFEMAKTRATAALRPRLFNTGFGGLVIYVDGIDEKRGLLKGLMVSDERESYRRTTVFASAGQLVTDESARSVYLRLLDGTSISYHAGQESYDKTDFESLEVNLDVGNDTRAVRSSTVDPDEMAWRDLVASRDEKLASGQPATEERIEIQRKFVLSAASLVLALVGVPLGMQKSRAVHARGFAVSIGIILAYYVLLSGAVALVRRGTLDASYGMWLPNVIIGALGLAMFVRTARDRTPYPSLGAWMHRTRAPSRHQR